MYFMTEANSPCQEYVLTGLGSVEKEVEELEGGCCCCVECKMRIADIARKYRQAS